MDPEDLFRVATNPNRNLEELRNIQDEIAKKVILQDDFSTPLEYIGGIDTAYINDIAVTACIILEWPSLQLLEQKIVEVEVKFPYISTYFVFREGPPILKVLSKINRKPNLLLINSQGILHPRFAGCASHIGVITEIPTIGVAQKALLGTWASEPTIVKDWVPIYYGDKIVGAYFLSQKGNKPIFISPGHRISLETAVEIVKNSITKNRMPEPLHLAHQLAKEKKQELEQGIQN